MTGIKVREIAYIRLGAPDLDVQQEFLLHFGMQLLKRTDDRLYMRGTDSAQYIHVTEKGDARFIGLAWYAKSEDDLNTLSELDDASDVMNLDGPGGGKVVRMTDPNGYLVEVVHGIAELEPLEVENRKMNDSRNPLNRAGVLMRTQRGPSAVKRIAHGVIFSPKFEETLMWYRERLGFIGSDDIYAGHPDNMIASFSRCDAGETYVDHHTFFTMKSEKAGLNHVSFEVQDIDDVFLGHHYLKELGKYPHMWGIGRHVPGSQIFDYWEDPWGRVHEHWTDSDRLNVNSGTNHVPVEEGMASQWGDEPPKRFIDYVSE